MVGDVRESEGVEEVSKLKCGPGYRGGWCIHYKAPPLLFERDQRHVCEAGVDIETFQKFDVRPCFLDNGKSKPGALKCAHLRRPTQEEIAAHEQWHARRMNTLGAVMKAIEPWRKAHKGKSHAETIECPACKGRLHLSIAACNGHVHAQCETEGCVSWME